MSELDEMRASRRRIEDRITVVVAEMIAGFQTRFDVCVTGVRVDLSTIRVVGGARDSAVLGVRLEVEL